MNQFQRFYYEMPDGTIKQINPFSGTEVWTVPGRGNRPIFNVSRSAASKVEPHDPEDFCNFCPTKYLNTPPEKSRLVLENGQYRKLDQVLPTQAFDTVAEFRRVPNLFEIVTMDYWRMNHDFRLSPANEAWKASYLGEKEGYEHAKHILKLKLRLMGGPQDKIDNMTDEDVQRESDAFFGGGHELIIARRHYAPHAEYDNDICSSGDLTAEEHYVYFQFTLEALRDIYENNMYVRYVCIFQNWLAPAGASFDHLHKQMVALDEWGASVEREIDLIRRNPNIYNELILNFAIYQNFVFAENEYAIALAEMGHRFPTVAVYSKSRASRPYEQTDDELRGFSNLVHACHAAMGRHLACNEEWLFSPRDAVVKMPWHILLKWRTSNPAGFEGGTKIYVNPVGPRQVRDMMVERLYKLRDEKKVDGFEIAEECKLVPNCLNYHKN